MKARLFHLWCLTCTVGLVLCLGLLVGFIISRGAPALSLSLFFGDSDPLNALLGLEPIWDGIWPACVGTLTVVFCATALALLPGIATGIWLASRSQSRFKYLVALGIDILAGIPSILMGLFGFTLILFLRSWLLPTANTCLLLSALCLAMLIIPYLAVATRTALLALPHSLEITALSLGMSRWKTLRCVLLPQAVKGIIGGIMLAMGRAAEDTAVIMLTGAVANAGLPGGLFERYEALPFTIFYFSAQYQNDTELQMAFGAALTLLCLTATIFTSATLLQRNSLRKH
ncbi:phosphate ABC transporter permease [Photobacterium jeanii]|uniref:Phosphate ABC transporter permease n=1 Tax=Photobacterium jeanii TaxID=858640 RepID=A0A178KMV2_9GAMM|nr:ABC transporter permease subunit [Photobacterium jeanii]OAN18003.1 phosphate ABC transporter permease [Photobacterium jeanii]PST92327.1 phosphate ABC transporter permease [Photobacterium jeanii]